LKLYTAVIMMYRYLTVSLHVN